LLSLTVHELTCATLLHCVARVQGAGAGADQSIAENLSLPDELQKVLDQRIGMNMVGDLGRYAQLEAAQAIHGKAQQRWKTRTRAHACGAA
jgi:hypothetical protein